MPETRQRVHAATRGQRRFTTGLVLVLFAYLVVAFVTGASWQDRAVPILLLAGHLPIAVSNLGYLDVHANGLTLEQRVRRREIAWSSVAAVRLDWEWAQLRPRLPEIELTDGTRIRSGVLSQLRRARRADELDALLEHLGREADVHGFALEAEQPTRWTRAG